jgi:cardiolipin synthase A/B
MAEYLPHVTVAAALDLIAVLVIVPWVVMTKKDATSAVAWCLLVFFLPLIGALLFWVFGYNHVDRPILRKRQHRSRFRASYPPQRPEAARGEKGGDSGVATYSGLGELALRVNAFPVTPGNAVTFYDETKAAYDAILKAVAEARNHTHLEYFIIRPDETGKALLDLLTEKARQGVEVRLMYDSMGTRGLKRSLLRPLREAGGKVSAFLPLNPLRSRLQINLRNHRKITVVDGRVAFTGGMNVGDEYLGKHRYFGYWRDEVARLEGPAVAGLQRVFAEDWSFATGESVNDPAYFPPMEPAGDATVQVIESGPDQEINSIREVYFAAILTARERLWIASPYFVPDRGLLDALRLARYRGVDVRLLSLMKPDKWIAFLAARYYWSDMLAVGMKVYQYAKGMMHSKMMMVDGKWAFIGSANLDNRSLYLNFEAGCILHVPAKVKELEDSFLRDLEESEPLEEKVFSRRSFRARLAESACRLLSPVL